MLPLFPLGTVLFPGLVMPLHVFEERYRALVRHLLDLPDGSPRVFGVVAIRRGWEVEHMGGGLLLNERSLNEVSLHDVGCTAEVRQVTSHPDGRFDLVTVGRSRFSITKIVAGETPYLRAEVSYLPEEAGDEAAADRLGPQVLAAFRAYLRLIRTEGGLGAEIGEQLPENPQVLSHLIAATASLTLAERQHLLELPDTAARLRAELALMHREIGLLSQVRAVPMPLSELPVTPGPN